MEDKTTEKVIQAAYAVHRSLGAGFLESVYLNALALELRRSGVTVEMQVPIPVYYRDEKVGDFIADIVVEKNVILELKAVQELHPIHEAQLVNYLQATGIEIGLLINFGTSSVQVKRKYKEYRQTKPPISQLSLRPVNPENPVNPCVLKVVVD